MHMTATDEIPGEATRVREAHLIAAARHRRAAEAHDQAARTHRAAAAAGIGDVATHRRAVLVYEAARDNDYRAAELADRMARGE